MNTRASLIKLAVVDGSLAVGDNLLLYHYVAGDCDRIPWPLVAEFRTQHELLNQLADALMDERETGGIPADYDCYCFLLPDGMGFDAQEAKIYCVECDCDGGEHVPGCSYLEVSR